ncbi:MAG: ATP-binding protein [Halobacteriota archaeon]
MEVDWLEYYGLKGEPFSGGRPLIHPVEFKDIFVTTESIQNEIEPIIRTIEESDRHLYLILGERGAGKSTLLWYIVNKLNERDNILPIHISLAIKTYDTEYHERGLATDLSKRVAYQTLEGIKEKFNDLFLSSTYRLEQLEKKLEEPNLNLEKLTTIISKIFKALDENNKIPVITVDNLDKFKDDVALDFLSHHYAQPLFEQIFLPYGVKVFLTAVSKWSEKLNELNYSYLGEPIIIEPLNYLEAQTLIQKRIQRKVKDTENFIFPFKTDAIVFVTKVSNGIPRNIQDKCTTYMQQGAKYGVREIDKDFLLEIEKKVGKEFEIVRELSAHDPIVEKDIAFLLDIKTKFSDSKAFEKALFNVLDLLQGTKIDDDTLNQLRDSGIISMAIEDPKKPSKLAINSNIEELFSRVKEKMQLKGFIEWFCRSDVDTIPITKARWYILDDLARIRDSLPDEDFKKSQIEKILKDYESFRESYYEDEEQSACAETAFTIARTATGLIEPGMTVTNDFNSYLKMLKNSILPNEVRSDFQILHGYYCGAQDATISYRDLNVIQEKLNDLLENIQKLLEETSVEKIPILFSELDPTSLGNFLNKRLLETSLLMISTSEEEVVQHLLICWRSWKTGGIYGINIENGDWNYFDAVLAHYNASFPYIPYQIQDIIKLHKLPQNLEEMGIKKRFAQHYELALLVIHLATQYPQLKLIFASKDKASFWTVEGNVNKKRIELLEEETLTNTPLFPYLKKKLGTPEPETKKLNINEIPGEYENRVFIGGNYDYMPVLREMEKHIKESGFQPILAYDFDVPVNNIHDFDLRLLHNCKYAIFDETHPAGELMEIERIKDYGTIIFIVYQIRDSENKKPPAQVTSMVKSLDYPMKGYSSFDELKSIITKWLSDLGKNE